jgi:glycosyltransferase involved in cell wall biosynthesis
VKRFKVTDLRWADRQDLRLPHWRRWNSGHRLPRGFWQRVWEYPYATLSIPRDGKVLDFGGTYPFVLFRDFPAAVSVDIRDLNKEPHRLHEGLWPQGKLIVADAAKVPVADNAFDYAMSISAIEEMPHTLDVLREMVRVARHRVVATMDVAETLGLPQQRLREVEQFLGVPLPPMPRTALTSTSPGLLRSRQLPQPEYRDIRVLAFTLDAQDPPPAISVLIPHWNSWRFLEPCLDGIEHQAAPGLDVTVHVLDDASTDGSYEKARDYAATKPAIHVHRLERPNKSREADVGLLLDMGLDHVDTQYVAMIDADVVPLAPDWLSFPVWLLNELNCSSVGTDTGLANAYTYAPGARWWRGKAGLAPRAGTYDNARWTCTNNFFRVMRTATAKVVAREIGFTRANYPPGTGWKVFKHLARRLPPINRRYPYLPGGEDNGVAANHFIDANRLGPKFNIPLTSYIGLTTRDGAFGQNICGLLFHFALSTRALSDERREVEDAGGEYHAWLKRYLDAPSPEAWDEIVKASAQFRNGGLRGEYPMQDYVEDFEYIAALRAKRS